MTRVTVLLGDPRFPDPVKHQGKFNPEDMAVIASLKETLGTIPGFEFEFFDCHASLDYFLRTTASSQLVMNLCDEGYMNDPEKELHIPAMLDLLGVPYTGSPAATLGICFDKHLVRALAKESDVPVPEEVRLAPMTWLPHQWTPYNGISPWLVKPCKGDASVGIPHNAVVHGPSDLADRIKDLRVLFPDRAILVQEYLPGREFSTAILGDEFLPVIETVYEHLDPGLNQIQGYEAKWVPGTPWWDQIKFEQANLPGYQVRKLEMYSRVLFEKLGCRDYARFDWRTDKNGTIKFLEANPNPGWCFDGKFALIAKLAGMSYAQVLERILQAAMKRTPLCVS